MNRPIKKTKTADTHFIVGTVVDSMIRTFVIFSLVCLLSSLLFGCGGGGGGSSVTPAALNIPNLPPSPVSRLILSTDYVGIFIAKQPINADPASAASLQESQYLYQLSSDNSITPVLFLDTEGAEFDLLGNLSFTDKESVIPLDIMVMNESYILLTLFHRNFDTDTENDYFNLLIDLKTGIAISAPVGLNDIGNSGRSSLAKLGRDYFPPDSRWNDTEDLYIISIDYEALDMMQGADFTVDPFLQEPVDHHSGVPCPAPVNEEEDTDTTDSTEEDTADTEAETTEAAATETEDSTEAAEVETATQSTSACVGTVSVGGTNTDTSSAETPVTETVNPNAGELSTNETAGITNTNPTTGSFDEDGNPLENGQDPLPNQNTGNNTPVVKVEDLPLPTAIYKMLLGGIGGYDLERISFDDDRPGLGQFVVNGSGVIIYRNEDGGDNSYRVIQSNCEEETGRLSTVFYAPNTSFILQDDENGDNSVYEISENGMNKLEFSCNGNVVRRAHVSYSQRVNSLRLPSNSPSIAGYDYAFPYFINSGCDSGNLFPSNYPQVQMLNPMPPIPGLNSGDPRGLRKSQYFANELYCIGYNSALELSVASLDPSQYQPNYAFINFDFGNWIVDFQTVHVLSNNNLVFTANTPQSNVPQTVLLDDNGAETILDERLSGLKVLQQIEITPPPTTTP